VIEQTLTLRPSEYLRCGLERLSAWVAPAAQVVQRLAKVGDVNRLAHVAVHARLETALAVAAQRGAILPDIQDSQAEPRIRGV
jgi:hypothetical protein